MKEEIENDFLSINNKSITEGKYSAKGKNVFKEIEAFQKGKLCEKYKVRPIQFTFEITNRCNCRCEHCGMSAGSKTDKPRLSLSELEIIANECEKSGILSYAITGGEPFLEFDNMCKFIALNKGKLDCIKLISNGFWGKDVKKYFRGLQDAGLFENKFIVPSIQISIGEQDVPLEHVCNIIEYATKNYTNSQLHLGIIFTRSEKTGDKLSSLYDIYVKKFGTFPQKRVYLTLSEYKNYVKGQGEKLNVKSSSLYEEVGKCDNNFAQELGKFVSPKIFMKVNGDCYPCEIFNMHKDVYLGNLFTDGIESILNVYNSNKYIDFIRNYGTAMFREVIPERVLKENSAETPCMACEFCIKYCQEHNLIK